MVDTGWHDLDPGLDGTVVVDELANLLAAVGKDHVGTADDLGFGVHAPLWLEVAGLGLDPGQGVEDRDERQVELVLEPVSGLSAQPVVGEQAVEVIVDEVAGGPVGELVDDLREPLLGKVVAAGIDLYDPEARFDLDDLGGPVIGTAGEHGGLSARPGEGTHDLTNVDGHPATVPGAGLDQR